MKKGDKLYRFMSEFEFGELYHREQLAPRDQSRNANSANGAAFCFLAAETPIQHCEDAIPRMYTPEMCFQEFMRGIVCADVLVEFEVINADKIYSGCGAYADHTTFYDLLCVEEFYAEDYTALLPVRFAREDEYEHYTSWQPYTGGIMTADLSAFDRFTALTEGTTA